MDEATVVGAGSLAGPVCSLNQKPPLKSVPDPNVWCEGFAGRR